MKYLIADVQCECAMCNVSVHVKTYVQTWSVCTYVSLFTSLSMCHANLEVDVQFTQVCVDVISGCTRVSEMHKSVSVSKHLRMWCVKHGVRVWVFHDNATVSCQCVKRS